MKLVIVYNIPNEVNPRLNDPHDVAAALTDLNYHGKAIIKDERIKPEFVGAEWEDNARRVSLDALLAGES